MNTYIDIETIPGQGLYEEFLKDAQDNFKAPSDLTKTQACADLGLVGNDAKFTSKDDAIAQWVARFSKEKAPEVAEQNWRKTSFDGAKGEIISISWAIEDQEICARYRSLTGAETETRMLRDFFNTLAKQLNGRNPFFIGQFVAGFDLKFIFHRAVILGVKPPFDLPFNGRHDQHYYDTQQAWAGFKGRMSQDNMCKALGIEGKPGDISGANVWDHVRDGDIKRVVEYNIDDVNKVRQLHKRLTFS
jgi:hypothetical protein